MQQLQLLITSWADIFYIISYSGQVAVKPEAIA
jgi:hypothetical protein